MDIHYYIPKNSYWWGITSLLGGLAFIIPKELIKSSSPGISFLITLIILLLIGTAIGFLRPDRPWRWGIASVLLFPFIEIIQITIYSFEDSGHSFTISSFFSYQMVKIPLYALFTIPAIIGAYIGSYINKKRYKNDINVKIINFSQPWILGLSLGLLVSGLPILLLPIYEIFYALPYWVGGLFITSIIMGIIFHTQTWRLAIAVGLGLPAAVIIKIIVDLTFGIRSHNLFPFEIIIALFVAAAASFPGVYLGVFVRKGIMKFKKIN